MSKVQKRLIVKGYVQDVNYRETVKSIARKMKVFGSVKNLADTSVEIICECNNEQHLQDFKKTIFIKSESSYEPTVEDIQEIEYGPSVLGPFTIDYGDKQEELIKKFNIGVKATKKMNVDLCQETESLNVNLGEKMDSMNNNITNRFGDMDKKYGEIGKNLKRLVDIFETYDVTLKPKKNKKI